MKGAGAAVRPFGHVHQKDVRVELGRGVALDGAGGVVLELRRDEFAGRLGWIVAADPGLGVALQLGDGGGDGGGVSLPHPFIASHQSRQRNGLGCGESTVPTGAVLDRAGGRSIPVLVLLGGPVFHHLLAGLGVLAIRQTRKLLGADSPGKVHFRCELALPLARNCTILLVIALGAGSELHLVVGLCLA